MENTEKTAKARAEAKFKRVGTKLNEEHFATFEAIREQRGFKSPSAYVRHLIDLDSIDSVEEERKQNAILTQTNEVLRARIEELEGVIEKQSLTIEESNKYIKYIATKVKQSEQDGEVEEEVGFWGKILKIFGK